MNSALFTETPRKLGLSRILAGSLQANDLLPCTLLELPGPSLYPKIEIYGPLILGIQGIWSVDGGSRHIASYDPYGFTGMFFFCGHV